MMNPHQSPPPPPVHGTSAVSEAATTTLKDNGNHKPSKIATKQPLYMTYPINTTMELTLEPCNEVVRGVVYTTDEVSDTIVLKKSLTHTTIASEMIIINSSSVVEKKVDHRGWWQ